MRSRVGRDFRAAIRRTPGIDADAWTPRELRHSLVSLLSDSGVPIGEISRSRGSVRLRSADPADPPRIDVAHLRDAEDLARMVEATVEGRRLARTAPLAGFVSGAELAPGQAIGDDDIAGLARSIKDRAGSYHHPVGTCAMGLDQDAGAVVDARGAVYGVTELWVADASVIPRIPSANTNLTRIGVGPSGSPDGWAEADA
jgi:choline dehydrogenase-like flavoprotein